MPKFTKQPFYVHASAMEYMCSIGVWAENKEEAVKLFEEACRKANRPEYITWGPTVSAVRKGRPGTWSDCRKLFNKNLNKLWESGGYNYY